MCKLLGVHTGVCVRKRQIALVGDDVLVFLFSSQGHWGLFEGSDDLSPNVFSYLHKFLKSLFCVGTLPRGTNGDWQTDRRTDVGVCLLRVGWNCMVQKHHYFSPPDEVPHIPTFLVSPPGTCCCLFTTLSPCIGPLLGFIHQYSVAAFGRPPVVCSLTMLVFTERASRAAWKPDSTSRLSRRQIFWIDGRTRCQARVAVRAHCCWGVCCYSQSHEWWIPQAMKGCPPLSLSVCFPLRTNQEVERLLPHWCSYIFQLSFSFHSILFSLALLFTRVMAYCKSKNPSEKKPPVIYHNSSDCRHWVMLPYSICSLHILPAESMK